MEKQEWSAGWLGVQGQQLRQSETDLQQHPFWHPRDAWW